MKLILDETRLQEQSKDINYKTLDSKWISYDFLKLVVGIHPLSWLECDVRGITCPIQLQIK